MVVVAVVGVECTPDVLCCLIKFLGPSHEMGYCKSLDTTKFEIAALRMPKFNIHVIYKKPAPD